MKEKIYNKLKQAYSSLGLGDEILQAHAENLANLGFVNDANLETVTAAQKSFLEGLQKANDKRAADAAEKARKKAKEDFDAETKKKEEEAKKAAEEAAKKKAEEEAAKKKAEEEEAKKKAEEEAERKRQEELKKSTEIPDAIKKLLEERDAKAKAEREEYQNLIKQLNEQSTANKTSFDQMMKEQQQKTQSLLDSYNAMKKEADEAKAAMRKREHADLILAKAKELEIPQYRIDEGFIIADDADESAITSYLSKVAANIKANQLPKDKSFQLDGDKPSKEDVDAIAKSLVKNLN